MHYKDYAETRSELFEQFKQMLQPLIDHHKLAMVLVQFPPWFDCTAQNIKYILYVRQQLMMYRFVSSFDINHGLTINLRNKRCHF